jgi:tRNA modification GTPase
MKKVYKSRKTVVIANNKIDLLSERAKGELRIRECTLVNTSAINHIGVDHLMKVLNNQVLNISRIEEGESVTVTNERHYSALLKAKKGLSLSLESLEKERSGEFIAVDLRVAIDSIGEIIGLVTTEDILNNIFSKFCIGK